MKHLVLLASTLTGCVLPFGAWASDLPNWDIKAKCEAQAGNQSNKGFSSALCVAEEEAAQSALQPKWTLLPIQVQQHCSQFEAQTQSYKFLHIGVTTDLIRLKAAKGLCSGFCRPDPELDPLFPEGVPKPDIAAFPHWDIATGCDAALKGVGMAANGNTCVDEETAAQARAARIWSNLEGVIRFECLEMALPYQSYGLLDHCARTRVTVVK